MHGCQVGTKVLFCMPDMTNCILLVSDMFATRRTLQKPSARTHKDTETWTNKTLSTKP
jgi:hypothetical protein